MIPRDDEVMLRILNPECLKLRRLQGERSHRILEPDDHFHALSLVARPRAITLLCKREWMKVRALLRR